MSTMYSQFSLKYVEYMSKSWDFIKKKSRYKLNNK